MNNFEPATIADARRISRDGVIALFSGAAAAPNAPKELQASLTTEALEGLGYGAEELGEELFKEGFTWDPGTFLEVVMTRLPSTLDRLVSFG